MSEETPVRFIHPQVGEGRATIAFREADEAGVTEITYTVAYCSPKDQFARKKGRLIAEGRLKKEVGTRNIRLVHGKDKRPGYKEVNSVVMDAFEHFTRAEGPRWANR